ncbi:MAG: response regulator [Tepidisphaeraceae bacterium]
MAAGFTSKPAGGGGHKTDTASGKIGKTGVETINTILDKLDSVDDSAFRNRRSSSRCAFRRTDVPVRIHHPGGSTTAKVVYTRNLSASGVGFIYPSFLHTGTRVEAVLKRRLGGDDLLVGKVVFCAHVGGVFHQVGVKFEQKIFPKLYLDPGSYEEGEVEAPSNVAELAGHVLYVDDQELDRALLKHHLKGTKLELTAVTNAKEALVSLGSGKYDLVLCDLNLEGGTGEEAIKRIREQGYRGPICLVTAEHAPARLKAAQEAGAIGVLTKPYEQQKLLAMLGSWLNGTSGEPIISTLAGQSDVSAILSKFVARVHESAKELQINFESDNIEKLRQMCMAIKGTGSGYGFAALSEAAREAITSIDSTMSVAESAIQIQRLIDMCKRTTDKAAA